MTKPVAERLEDAIQELRDSQDRKLMAKFAIPHWAMVNSVVEQLASIRAEVEAMAEEMRGVADRLAREKP